MVDDIRKGYDFIKHKDETEIRMFFQNGSKQFYPTSFEEYKNIIDEYNGKAQIYLGINERMHSGSRGNEVKRITFIAIDIDSIRPEKDISATNEELKNALDTGKIINDWFISQGFEEPTMLRSGNGCYLWCAVPPMDITDDNRILVSTKLKAFQKLIKERFEGKKDKNGQYIIQPLLGELANHVNIDNIGDLARIIRVPGTLNIKGENTIERPHRYCEFINGGVRKEDSKLLNFIMSLTVEKVLPKKLDRIVCLNEEVSKRLDIVKRDNDLMSLLKGEKNNKYKSRSEVEMAIMNRLVFYELPKETIFEVMSAAKTEKWLNSHESYKELTYTRAIERMKTTYSQILKTNYPNDNKIIWVGKGGEK